jgi:hypothetical protein
VDELEREITAPAGLAVRQAIAELEGAGLVHSIGNLVAITPALARVDALGLIGI